MRNFLLMFAVVIAQSCASRGLKITSNIPSRIEIDGVTACQTTPCETSEICWMHGYGVRLEAFPLDKTQGYSQKKTVDAECDIFSSNIKNVFFEMDARPGVAVENSEVNAPLRTTKTDEEKEQQLKFLKKMHEQGNLSEELYNEQVKKILDK